MAGRRAALGLIFKSILEMRKFYSFMVAALAVMAAASCNKELQEVPQNSDKEIVKFTAFVDGADTKTELGESADGKRAALWSAGDTIAVLDGSSIYEFTTDITEASAKADFYYEGEFDATEVMAVYPYADWYEADLSTKTVKANIPTYQQANAGGYAPAAALAVAYSEDSSLSFKNAVALLKFTVATENVTHVTFFGNDTEAITGDVNVTLDENNAVSVECLETEYVSGEGEEKTVETKYGTWVELYAWQSDDVTVFSTSEEYYIAIAPQSFENGFGIEFTMNGVKTKVVSYDSPCEFKASHIYNLGEIEYVAPETKTVKVYCQTDYINLYAWTSTGYFLAGVWPGSSFTSEEEIVDGKAYKMWEIQVPVDKFTSETCQFIFNDGTNQTDDSLPMEFADEMFLYVVNNIPSLNPEGDPTPEPDPDPTPAGDWYLVGNFNGWATGDVNYKMSLENGWYVFKGFVADGEGVKFNAGNWDVNRGGKFTAADEAIWVSQGGADIVVPEGTYDVYLNESASIAYFMSSGQVPGDETPAKAWYLVGVFNGWTTGDDDYKMSLEDDWYVFKGFVADGGDVKLNAGTWAENRGGTFVAADVAINVTQDGDNMMVTAGTYDVYLNKAEDTLYFMTPGSKPAN